MAEIEMDLVASKGVKVWKQVKDNEEKGKVYFDTTPLPAGILVDDDYRPFMERGVKILHLISYPFPAVWHRQSDTIANIHYDTVDDLNKKIRIYVSEFVTRQF